MRQIDPVHRRAEANRLVEVDDRLVRVAIGEPFHEVQLGADRERRAGGCLVDGADDVFGRADEVGARCALDDVQTVPPLRPVNDLIAADEFMYVTGIVESATPASVSASQQSSTWSKLAMSAIEQPAARSGSTTCWCGAVRMSADSAMKCTPQKTM